MNTTIYIAGKVSGLPHWKAKLNFDRAAKYWRERAYTVINPMEIVVDPNTDWETAMRICIKAMMDAGTIFMLHNWRDSEGAIIEHDLAEKLKMKIIYEDEIPGLV